MNLLLFGIRMIAVLYTQTVQFELDLYLNDTDSEGCTVHKHQEMTKEKNRELMRFERSFVK